MVLIHIFLETAGFQNGQKAEITNHDLALSERQGHILNTYRSRATV
jgi:hypothetical protein